MNLNQTKPITVILLLGLLLLATWLRLWQLNTTPPGLWFDESYNAMDAAWMMDFQSWSIFLVGNNGREAMYAYLLAGAVTLLGETSYAVRLVSVVLGILTVPLMFVWVTRMFKYQLSQARWVALVSVAGLITSLWVQIMNRTAYRANLMPVFVIVTCYCFWRGWQQKRWLFYSLAGISLGLAQYTYFSARLLPLTFVVFVVLRSLIDRRNLKQSWLGLILMGVVSAIVAAPMLVFMFNQPNVAWGRTAQVAVGPSAGWAIFGAHLWEAIRVFIDGQDPNWRHHLLGQPVFSVVDTIGFFAGLLVIVKYFKKPAHQFLVILLLVMWLPAALSTPAFHTLRLAGILPAYYAIMGLGWVKLTTWLAGKLAQPRLVSRASPIALIVVLVLGGGITIYRYFYNWSTLVEVRQAFDTPVTELANQLTDSAMDINIIIPFYLYTHATMRYLLHNDYEEKILKTTTFEKTPEFLLPVYPPDDGKPPAFVWLQKSAGQPGVAYVSAVHRGVELSGNSEVVETLVDPQNQPIGQKLSLDSSDFSELFPTVLPQRTTSVRWKDNLLLQGYEFTPSTIMPGDTTNLYLNWKLLGITGLNEKMFLQLIDNNGNPISQQEIDAISRKMYRWRKDETVLELHPLAFNEDVSPGIYFARIGFFNPKNGQRLTANIPDGSLPGNEMILGPIYVQPNNTYFQPPNIINAQLDDSIKLLGHSIDLDGDGSAKITLFWQATAQPKVDYTVFLQLLDADSTVISQVDAQPALGIFPTSQWQSGDVMVQKLVLPVSSNELRANRLFTGMYELATGTRLPIYGEQGELLPDGAIQLIESN